MARRRSVVRRWLIDVAPEEVQIRCIYHRSDKLIQKFTVQLELYIDNEWRPIARYDNAHGFCHRDTIHPDGTQEKTPVFYGDSNETFTQAIRDLRTNWETYRAQFFGRGKR